MSKKAKIAIIVSAIVVVSGLVVAGLIEANHANQIRLQQEEYERQVKEYNSYIDTCELTLSTILDGATKAENAGNTINKVWHAAIYEDNIDNWDEDIKAYYSNDFNDALTLLSNSSDFVYQKAQIESNNALVESYMKDLSNPPEGCEQAYSDIRDLYQSYASFTNLVTDVSGSYNSFSSDFGTLDQEILSKYKLASTSIPNRIESNQNQE